MHIQIDRSAEGDQVAQTFGRNQQKKKGTPLQSAMSMLNFYINRAGKNLPATQEKVLNAAKDKLRQLFGRKETE